MTDGTVVTPKALFAANQTLSRGSQEIRHNCHICHNMRYLNSVLRDRCGVPFRQYRRTDFKIRPTSMPTFGAGVGESHKRRNKGAPMDQAQAKADHPRDAPRLSVRDATSSLFAGGCPSATDALAKYRYTPSVGKADLALPKLGQASSDSWPHASLQPA
jgi:hypothetical protein